MNHFRIMMLGVGNGFVKETYHNNALLEVQGNYYLIDCGATAWQSLHELGMGFEQVQGIFLTHLHYDHSGGLEEAALYGAYVAGRKMKLYLPLPLAFELWEHTLKGALENPVEGKVSLEDYFEVSITKEGQCFSFHTLPVYWLQTEHVPGKFSCSLVLDDRLFYSSDMKANLRLLKVLNAAGIEAFYHDVSFRENLVHAQFSELRTFPPFLLRRMYLMHYAFLPQDMGYLDLAGMTLLEQHQWMEW